jgi:hypothetical protein
VPVAHTVPTGAYGEADGANGTGLWGYSTSATGTGVYGQSAIGVWGYGGIGVYGANHGTGAGVYGASIAGSSVPNPPPEVGVFGYTDTGYGVFAQATSGTALYVSGKARFSRSGRTYVASGASSRKITMAGVTTGSYIIATPQTNRPGVFVQAVVPVAGSFTIYLNKAVPGTTYIGYLVIN